jgi:plasmid stability protein
MSSGRSMEEEARDILRRTVGDDLPRDLAAAIRARVAPAARVDLDLPAREPMRRPPQLGRRLR